MKIYLITILLAFCFSGYSQEVSTSKKIVSDKQTTETIELSSPNKNTESQTSNKKVPTSLPLNKIQNINSDTLDNSGHVKNSSKRIPKN